MPSWYPPFGNASTRPYPHCGMPFPFHEVQCRQCGAYIPAASSTNAAPRPSSAPCWDGGSAGEHLPVGSSQSAPFGEFPAPGQPFHPPQPSSPPRSLLFFGLSLDAVGLLDGRLVGTYFGIFGSFGFDWLVLLIGLVGVSLLVGYLGYQAALSTGRSGSGRRIGLLTGPVSAVVFLLISVIGGFVPGSGWQIYRIGLASDPVLAFFLGPLMGGTSEGVLLALVIGAGGVFCLIGLGAGALGGALGQRRVQSPSFPPHSQDAGAMLPAPPPPQSYALQGDLPPPASAPPGVSASLPSQRPAPLPPSSPFMRPKRWLSSAVIALLMALILMLLGGGSLLAYHTVSGRLLWNTEPSLARLATVVWSGTQFVAVGDGGTILTSPDGRTWTIQTCGTSLPLSGVAWSGKQFVIVGSDCPPDYSDCTKGIILTSPDGRAWTTLTAGTSSPSPRGA